MNVVEKKAVHEHMAYKEETADHYYNIVHITKKSSRGHQLLKKTLGLDTSVATRSRSETRSENSAKSNEEESEPSIQDEGLSNGQVEVIEMFFSSQINSQAPITFDIVRKTQDNISNALCIIYIFSSISSVLGCNGATGFLSPKFASLCSLYFYFY